MPNLTILPLDQLCHDCTSLVQPLTLVAAAAWAELLRRALHEHSDAAWDALVVGLWPAVLIWIYEQRPDLAPATAELVAQRVIFQFCANGHTFADGAEAIDAAAVRQLLQSLIAMWLSPPD